MKFLLPLFYMCSFLLSACQQGDSMEISVCPPTSDDVGEHQIQFQFAAPVSNRTTDNIRNEESKVSHLIYAIFQNSLFRKIEEVELQPEQMQDNKYTVTIPKQWLDGNTEIFAVANAPDELKNNLKQESYQISDNDPVLERLVEEQIDSLAKAYIYTAIFEANYNHTPFPKDNKIHYFPISPSNFEEGFFNLDDAYRCQSYDEFVKRFHDSNLPKEVKEIYERMWVDLQCRIVNYKSKEVDEKKKELTEQENLNPVLHEAWKKNTALQRYLLWRNVEWEKDLNKEAAANSSKWIDKPVMAGLRSLDEDFPTTIVVPVERIYCRVWFQFEWDAQQDADAIMVDEISVNGLMKKTRLFNINKTVVGNNPDQFETMSVTLNNPSRTSQSVMTPFFADLNLNKFPYHLGDSPQMLLQKNQPNFHTLSVYQQVSSGDIDKQSRPHRCYVYSFQRDGNALNDNPQIIVKYHFMQKSNNATEQNSSIYKKATARLYDEVHQPGKRHHGLLRNYTYQLNCKMTTLSQRLDLQVIAVPWYAFKVEDIPTFE